jgi:hypothetical protein
MSEALYLALEEDIDSDSYIQLEACAKAMKKLDRIAREIGVTALGQFVYGHEDDYADVAEHEGWAGSDYQGSGDGWHDAGDGLECVQALIGYVESDPEVLKRPKATLTELRSLEKVLEEASQAGVRFRLEVDE